MAIRREERLLIACLWVGGLLAQQPPHPGEVQSFAVSLPQGVTARAHGVAPRGYLEHGFYPLVIVLGDRATTAATTMRGLPGDVIDRKQMIVVAPELPEVVESDFAQLQQLVAATANAAAKKWSIHPERVVLLGVGRGASRALALARATPPCGRAVLALAPDDAWLPADGLATEPVDVQALAVTASGKARRFADALRDAHGDRLPVQVSEREDADKARPGVLLQPALDWFAARLAPPPKDGKERIHGRTTAAAGSKQRVLAITGDFDTVEDVLTDLEIPHLKMTWGELAKFELVETDVLLINCSSGEAYGEVRVRINKKLRRFVADGGYLFGTDWALRWPVSEVFADYIGDVDPEFEDDFVVDVRPTAASGNHELLQNVFPLDQPLPRWQIDARSFLVGQRQGLEVLLKSKELGAKFNGNEMLGVCFRVGAYGGRVLNVVSHFAHQGDGSPTTPMFQLIVNFVNAARRQRTTKR